MGYDGIYVIKAAVEGARTTAAPAFAAWVEESLRKAPDVMTINSALGASKESHFLPTGDTFAMTSVATTQKDGTNTRMSCP
jgi:hypothetical protein